MTQSRSLRGTLETVILDYQEMHLETGVPRRLRLGVVPGKATVCIGVRRCGKSTYLHQIIQKLLDEGVPRENILYLNLFDDRLHQLAADNIGLITEAFYAIHPEKKGAETVHCFFDEIQAVPGWEPFVDRLLRTERCEVYLTGSSAQMLSKEIATQMRGRALSWELFPFSFAEFLVARDIEFEGPLSTKRQLLVRKAFASYWETGGFPEVVELDRDLRIRTHQEYLQAILFRDLVERHDVSHPRAVSDLAHWLVDNTASLYSINKLTGYLKSLGHKVPKASVSDYVGWFEDAYFLFTVRLHDASLSRSLANPKKIYCIDHALVRSVSSGILINSGHLLENLVFTTLRRRHSAVRYYRSKTGKEVDFIVPAQDRGYTLVQASETLSSPKTREREIAGLREAMEELGIEEGTIVTRDEDEEIEIGDRTVHVVPIWRFLLADG